MGNSPRMPPPSSDRVTPLPDIGGAANQQAKYDALKELLNRRGRSSTLKTWGKRRAGVELSGRLSDVPAGGRESTEIARGG